MTDKLRKGTRVEVTGSQFSDRWEQGRYGIVVRDEGKVVVVKLLGRWASRHGAKDREVRVRRNKVEALPDIERESYKVTATVNYEVTLAREVDDDSTLPKGKELERALLEALRVDVYNSWHSVRFDPKAKYRDPKVTIESIEEA